jgi:hypothetical protein
VRRYATAATPDQLIPGSRVTRSGLLGPHQAYLRQRWEEDCRSTERLHEELRARGYRGSLRTLRRLTARLRQDTAVPATPPAPAAKKVASWILTPPGKLTDTNHTALAQITGRCEELAATRALVRDFADMLCHRHGEHLEAWASQAEGSPVSELHSFAKGLRKDWAAVTAGAHPAPQLRRRGRPRQPHQNDQKTDVRAGQTRPAPQARPARRLTRSPKLSQSHFLMATDSTERPQPLLDPCPDTAIPHQQGLFAFEAVGAQMVPLSWDWWSVKAGIRRGLARMRPTASSAVPSSWCSPLPLQTSVTGVGTESSRLSTPLLRACRTRSRGIGGD